MPPGSHGVPFTRAFVVGWGQVDANGHMRNTAFFDAAADTRLAFLESRGWDRPRLETTGLGVIAFTEEVAYRRELRLRDPFVVTLELAGVRSDGSRARLRSRFLAVDGTEHAALTSEIGWMDLTTRRLEAVPPMLAETFLELTTTDDFRGLDLGEAVRTGVRHLHVLPRDAGR